MRQKVIGIEYLLFSTKDTKIYLHQPLVFLLFTNNLSRSYNKNLLAKGNIDKKETNWRRL